MFFTRDGAAVGKAENSNGRASPLEAPSCKGIRDEEIDEVSQATINRSTLVASDAKDVDAKLYLRLPVNDETGNLRIVDGQCAICFSEYEPDDKVVRAGLEPCQHAFHADCILPWLAFGKKRCPTCRQWFVAGTGSRTENQEQVHRERLQTEADASSSETTDGTQDDSESHFENSGTAVGLGTAQDSQPVHASLPIGIDVEYGNASDMSPFNDLQ